MKFTFEFSGEICTGDVQIIETDGVEEYEITYNNQRAIIFQDVDSINDDFTFLWFQKTSPDKKSWPNDLIQAIGESVVELDYFPDSFIAAFKYKGTEYSAEVIKVDAGYKMISYWLPDMSLSQKSYLIRQIGNKWEIENYSGNNQVWVDMLGNAIKAQGI